MSERVVVSVGTKKGQFTLLSSPDRKRFEIRGPSLAGATVYTSMIDTRGKPAIYAGATSYFFGTKVFRSDDLGKTFHQTKTSPLFTKKDGRAMKNIWQIVAGTGTRDLWCGVEPASLFHSKDAGATWQPVKGLNDHPHARKWTPGNGGLCLNSILPINGRIHVSISAAGHYRSDDAGKTWHPRNRGILAGFQPKHDPEYGQCLHRIAVHPARPNRLYGQNHGGFENTPGCGVVRSDDGGTTWRSIAKGLPSDFGFPMALHPHDPDTAFIIPLEPTTRTCPKGAPAVYRTTNAGESWQRMSAGFPKQDAYFTVLRDALDVDRLPNPGVYFGTTTGQIWASTDGGTAWRRIAESLPPIHSVKAAAIR